MSGEYLNFWTLITMVIIVQLYARKSVFRFSSSPEGFLEIL